MASLDLRKLEKALIGRIRRAAHYKLLSASEPAIIHGPKGQQEAILAELARQGRWASMVKHFSIKSEGQG